MATVSKRAQGKAKRAPWYIGFTDERNIRRTRKGFTDKAETERLAAKLEHEVMLRIRGLVDPKDEEAAAKQNTPLTEHLQDFEKSLKQKANTGKHVKLTMTRVRRIVEDASFEKAGDIDADSVREVLAEMRESGEIGARTSNHYLQAIDQFCTWLVPKRVPANPLAGMERLNTEVDIRHPRRALSAEEFGALVQSARESGVSIQHERCSDGCKQAQQSFPHWIFAHEINRDGSRRTLRSVTVQKRYKDGEEVKYASSFNLSELPLVIRVFQIAQDYVESSEAEIHLSD